MAKKDAPISFPKSVLKPVSEFLSSQLSLLKKTQKKVEKEDPFEDLDRDIQSAAPDAEAEEQVTHLRSVAMQVSLARKIIQTRRALARIKIGKYGICENCGNMIDTDRLMVTPEATLCVKCERLREKQK